MSASREKTAASKRHQALHVAHLALHATLVLFVLALGCTLVNSLVFIPKKELSATPAKSGITYREVWFQAEDGVPLNGWFLAGARGLPLILFFHGNGGNLSDNLGYLELLHGRGFPIFIFDYRGYGRSGGRPLREEDLYQDARGAISYLEGAGWRHEAMIFFGQSLGSAVALQMALEAPPAGLVMESSFTCMKDIVRYVSPFGYFTLGWWGMDIPFDNISKIAGLGVPLLMIHGDRDRVVPVEMTVRLYERAPGPKMLHIVKGGGHCDVLKLDRAAYLAAWNSYLNAVAIRGEAPLSGGR